MSVELYDTLSRSIKPLAPTSSDTLRFYCCGPTVYGPAHIGNFRTFLIQDTLRRVLEVDGCAGAVARARRAVSTAQSLWGSERASRTLPVP